MHVIQIHPAIASLDADGSKLSPYATLCQVAGKARPVEWHLLSK